MVKESPNLYFVAQGVITEHTLLRVLVRTHVLCTVSFLALFQDGLIYRSRVDRQILYIAHTSELYVQSMEAHIVLRKNRECNNQVRFLNTCKNVRTSVIPESNLQSKSQVIKQKTKNSSYSNPQAETQSLYSVICISTAR
jgi:hypothetical protein